MAPHRTPRRAPRRTPHQLASSAKANGYKRGQNREENRRVGLRTYAPVTDNASDAAHYLYACWCFNRAEEEYKEALEDGLTDAVPPDFDTVRNTVLCENAPLPSIEDVKDFMEFVLASSKGLISDKMTARSLRSVAENFVRAFRVKARAEIGEAYTKELYHWVWHYLPSIGKIVKQSKPKFNFGVRDLDRVLVALWRQLTCVHERLRVEIHFLFLLDISAGARIAALFKGGIRYKDIQIVLARREDGSYGWYWKWDERYVKNNPDPENFWIGIAGSNHQILRYDNTAYLLAMALADNALYGYKTPQDLWQQEIPEGDTETILLWNDDVLELPIVRAIGKGGRVSDSKLSERTFRKIFRNVLDLAEYVNVSPSLHKIRRQFGKGVDGLYTEAQRGQILGQRDSDVYGREYLANCSSVDGRSSYLGETPDHRPHEYFQSLEMFHENGVPNNLPHARRLQIEDDPRIQDLIRQVSEAEGSSERALASTALSSLRSQLGVSALESYRKEWIEERRKEKIRTRGKLSPVKSELLLGLIDPIPEREKVASLVLQKEPLGEEAMRQAVGYLYALCTRDATVRYYRGEEPINGLCRFCSTPMSRIQRSKSSHAHMCCKKTLATRWAVPPSKLRFCFICAEWFLEGHLWEAHCLTHLEKPFVRCGSTVIRRTVIRPAYCPFHLVSGRKPSERMQAWDRDADAVRHIKDEEVRNEYPTSCCGAELMTETDLDCHLVDVHGFNIRARPAPGRDGMDSKQDIDVMKDSSPGIKDEFHRALMTSLESATSPTSSSGPSSRSNLLSQTTISGSELISQTSDSVLKSDSEPPDFMWDYVLLSSPSHSPSPLLEPIDPSSDNSSVSNGSTQQSSTALCSLPDLGSPGTSLESTIDLTQDSSGRTSPLQLSSSPDTSTLDFDLFGRSDRAHNALTGLAVSPKKIFPSQGGDSRLVEDKDTPPSRPIIPKRTGFQAQGIPVGDRKSTIVLKTTGSNSTGSRKQSKKRRETASSRLTDNQANPPKRRIVLKKPQSEKPKKRIVLKKS